MNTLTDLQLASLLSRRYPAEVRAAATYELGLRTGRRIARARLTASRR